MTDFLPTQDPGPAPTDVPLASWQSYSAYTTSTYEYTTTITKVAYDPAGITAPSVEVEAKVVHTTSTGYTVVNVPLLYTGPFPAPPLGTLFTTHGEVLRPTPSSHSISAVTPTPTAGSDGNSNKGSSPSQPIAASSPVATASARPNNSGSNSNNGGGQNAGTTTANAQGGSGNAGVQSSQQQQGSPSTPTASSGSDGQGGQSLGSGSASNSVATPAPQPTTRPLPSSAASANSILSNAAASASIESVSASNAAASASLASVSATNAAQSSSASAASVSAANAASSASALSASASLQSAASSSIASSPHPTSSTSTVAGSPLNLASHGLSGGQIAGIVLGSVFGLLLLLLLVGLLLARRRRRNVVGSGAAAERGAAGGGVGRKLSDKWASGLSRTGGDYAALGAGAGLAGLAMGAAGAAGATRADSLNSNEWEEDRLSGRDGSGFFVVGGKRAGGRQHTREEVNSDGGDPFASESDAAVGGLAGFGAGLAAALTGRWKARDSGKSMESDHQAVLTSSREADLADEDERAFMSDEDADPNSEGRGLMSFADVGDSSEMTQAGPSGWTQMPSRGGEGYAGWGSAAVLGAGAMSAARRGKSKDYGRSENKGQLNSHDESSWLAGEASGSSRAARRGQRSSADRYLPSSSPAREHPMQSYGNAASSSSINGHDRIPSFSGTFGDGDGDLSNHPYDEEALLGTTGAAGVGLAALAAGHRDSGHSQIESDNGHDDSFSRFLSQDTPLLGPGAYETRDQQTARRSSAMYSQPNRLSTIRSVGEFGEKDSQAPSMGQSSTSGTGSGSARYGRGRNVPLYASSSAPSVNSPSQQFASISDDHRREGQEEPSSSGMGSVAGFLGGLIPSLGGWTRSEDTDGYPSDFGGRGSIRPLAVGHERGEENDTAETHSQRASVYNNGSRISHKQPSPTESGQSSASNSVPSHISRNEADEEHGRETFDDDAATGGYPASVSNQSQNVSSGNSRIDSRRSGQTMSTRFTRDTRSGSNSNSQGNSGSLGSSRRNESFSGYSGSTGAASYNPSYLARQSTSSTRGVGASSGSSGLASRGGNTSSSSSRRTREDGSSSAASRLLGSDGRSSRATAGDGEDLSRVSFDPGLANLEEVSNEGGSLPSADYYPSESLGAAMRRRVDQDEQHEQGGSVPPLLYPALTSTSVPPLSTQWRQSPRVESVSERANAYLLRQGPSLYASLTQPPGPSTTPPRRPPRRSQPSPSEVRPPQGSI